MVETKSQNLTTDATAYEPHPIADLFPLMEGKPFDELVADIKAHGLKEQIKLWQGKIIDGRNRYRACQIAGVKPIFKTQNWATEAEALDYVTSRNIQRRHLTVAERSVVAARISTRRGKTGRAAGSTQSKAAEMLGVSERSVRNAKAVIEYASELLPAVEAGEMGLETAAEIARRGYPPPLPDPDAEAPDGPAPAGPLDDDQSPTESTSEQPKTQRAPRQSDPNPPQRGPIIMAKRVELDDLQDGEVATLIEEMIEKRPGVRRALGAKPHVLEQLGGFEAARSAVSMWMRGERRDSERATFVREAFNTIIEKATKEQLLASLAGGPPVSFTAQPNATDLSQELWATAKNRPGLTVGELAKLAKAER